MLEPLSALSLASSIIQFADFGIHVVEVILQIHQSTDGARTSNIQYEAWAHDLAENTARIEQALQRIDTAGKPKERDDTLKRVAANCKDAVDDLCALLNKLKKKEKSGKWETVSKALASIWNKERIDDMLKRLEMARENAEFQILLNVSEKLDVLFDRQKKLSNRLDDSTNSIVQSLHKNRELTQNVLVGQTDTVVQLHRMLENSIENNVKDAKLEIISAIRMLDWTTTSANWERNKSYSASLTQIQKSLQADAHEKYKFRSRLVNALHFSAMTERLEDISEAHKRTFQWVYEPPDQNTSWDDFAEWLECKTGIYWIRGKPGSGKSCLMKYLFDELKTKSLLKTWSEELPLIMAGFFFWYAGTDMQKSQNGLLRSILFQILDQHPKLITVAYPVHWDYAQKGVDLPFTNSRKELINAVTRITTQTTLPLKLCLFIDGLDEFNGDYSEIIELFTIVATSPSTKLCVSSRPWPVFMNAFNSSPGLILQDLTRGDIREYVNARLEESPGMKELQASQPEEAFSLVQEIVDKSSGVFLWVRLVVTSLISGLTNNDRIEDLQQRMNQLPEELEELYIYMLKRIDPFYLGQALRLLYIVQHSCRALPSIVISIADESDASSFINCWPSRLPDDDVTSKCQKIEDKIQSRCLGLLECHLQPPPAEITPDAPIYDDSCLSNLMHYCRYSRPTRRVQFMHRTVKDFFDKPDIDAEFLPSLGGKPLNFDANKALCFAALAQLKRLFAISHYGSWASAYQTFWALINECLLYAAKIERKKKESVTAILNDLERTATYYYNKQKDVRTWPETWIHTHASYRSCPREYNRRTMFLALAVNHGLEYFLKDKFENQGTSMATLGQQQLDFLLSVAAKVKRPNPRICKILLNAGADPNASETTTWQELLGAVVRRSDRRPNMSAEESSNDDAVLEHFIHHGANLDISISSSTCDDLVPVPFILLRRGSSRLVGTILDYGVSPVREWIYLPRNVTLWQEALRYIYQDLFPRWETSSQPPCLKEWLEIYQLLLEHDAHPLQKATVIQRVGLNRQLRSIGVMNVIREVFSKWDPIGASCLQSQLTKNVTGDLRFQSPSASPSPLLSLPLQDALSVTHEVTSGSQPSSPGCPRPLSVNSVPPPSPPSAQEVSPGDQKCLSTKAKQAKRLSFAEYFSRLNISRTWLRSKSVELKKG